MREYYALHAFLKNDDELMMMHEGILMIMVRIQRVKLRESASLYLWSSALREVKSDRLWMLTRNQDVGQGRGNSAADALKVLKTSTEYSE